MNQKAYFFSFKNHSYLCFWYKRFKKKDCDVYPKVQEMTIFLEIAWKTLRNSLGRSSIKHDGKILLISIHRLHWGNSKILDSFYLIL